MGKLASNIESRMQEEQDDRGGGAVYNLFLYQVVIAEQTVQHCSTLSKEHKGYSERDLVKALA